MTSALPLDKRRTDSGILPGSSKLNQYLAAQRKLSNAVAYGKPGGEAIVGATDGFGTGGLVAVGNGGGGSSSTVCVGDGEGFLVFEFPFVLSLMLAPRSPGSSPGAGEAEVLAFSLLLAVWFVVPPDGIPASDSPVAGLAGSTGLLLGSATNGEPAGAAPVGCGSRESA